MTQYAILSVKCRNSSCICLSFLSLYYQCPDPDVEKILEVQILVKKELVMGKVPIQLLYSGRSWVGNVSLSQNPSRHCPQCCLIHFNPRWCLCHYSSFLPIPLHLFPTLIHLLCCFVLLCLPCTIFTDRLNSV